MPRRLVPFVMLLLAVGFFWRLWPAPDAFVYPPNSQYSDLTITHWPNAFFIRRSLATWGQIPLWRPLILGGEPFAANPLSGLWYPPNLLLLVLPLTLAFNLLFVLHMAWAGCGGYLMARSMGASRAGGWLAAVILMTAPKAIAHLSAGHVGLYYAWTWLPWVVWTTRRLAKHSHLRDAAGAAMTVTCLVLADVRLGFYSGLVALGCWAWQVGRRLRRAQPSDQCARGVWFTRLIVPGIAAGLLVGALLAIQVVPLAAIAGRLNRGGLTLEESGIASIPPRYLVGLLVADHGGFQEWMTYVGASGLLLAGVGLARWRARERWCWAGLALAAAIYSLGTYTPVYAWLYRVLPPLKWLRGPARAWFLVVLAVATLAAQGMTALEQGMRRRRWVNPAAVALAGAALFGMAGAAILDLTTNVMAAVVIWPLTGAVILCRAGRSLRASLFVKLILPLALADLWWVGFTLYQVRAPDDVLAEGKLTASWLADFERPFRVYSPSYSIPQHTGAVYGIETVDGVDPFQLSDYVRFMTAATGVAMPGYSVTIPSFPAVPEGEDMLLALQGVEPDLRLLGLLGVEYLAAEYPMEMEGLTPLGEREGVYVYRNAEVLPRAFVVESADTVDGLEGALSWLMENDPSRAAVVESERALHGERVRRDARIVDLTPNRIQVEADGPGLLVLSEVFDPDWYAHIDGSTTDVVRADGALRGVYLPEGGVHVVTFEYRPAGLWVGLTVTALGTVCVAALLAVGSRPIWEPR